MKLSELTYEYLKSVGLGRTHIHTDCSDAMRLVSGKEQFDRAKDELMARYGDVDLIVTPDAPWFDQIKIDNANWQADFDEYCRKKAIWCFNNGCD